MHAWDWDQCAVELHYVYMGTPCLHGCNDAMLLKERELSNLF